MRERLDTMAKAQRVFGWMLSPLIAAGLLLMITGTVLALTDPARRANLVAGLPYVLGLFLVVVAVRSTIAIALRRAYARLEDASSGARWRWVDRAIAAIWITWFFVDHAADVGQAVVEGGPNAAVRELLLPFIVGFGVLTAISVAGVYFGSRRWQGRTAA